MHLRKRCVERAHAEADQVIAGSIITVDLLPLIEGLPEGLRCLLRYHADGHVTWVLARCVENVNLRERGKQLHQVAHHLLCLFGTCLDWCFDKVAQTCIKLSELYRVAPTYLKPLETLLARSELRVLCSQHCAIGTEPATEPWGNRAMPRVQVEASYTAWAWTHVLGWW